MKPKAPRTPFDHVKDIYGDRLEKYSYQELNRDPGISKKVQSENIRNNRFNYEDIRGRILEYVLLAFIVFMLGAGVYFILNGIISA